MRKVLVSVAGALGLAALYRLLRRRSARTEPMAARDPADELRAAIADAETQTGDADEQVDAPLSLAERRRRVHERAQEAIDSMGEPPAGG